MRTNHTASLNELTDLFIPDAKDVPAGGSSRPPPIINMKNIILSTTRSSMSAQHDSRQNTALCASGVVDRVENKARKSLLEARHNERVKEFFDESLQLLNMMSDQKILIMQEVKGNFCKLFHYDFSLFI